MVDLVKKLLREKPNCQKVLDYLCDSWSGKADKGLFLWGCGKALGLGYYEMDEAIRYLHGSGVIQIKHYIYARLPRARISIIFREYTSSQPR